MRPRSLAGVSRSGPGSKGGAEPRRLALLPGRVRLFAAAAGATYLGAQRADPDPAPPRPLEAGLHGRDLLLPTGRVAGPAVLPQPARQLQRPHPDRRAQATAPLPTRRARHLDLGQPALPPQPGHGRLAGDPAPLAPGRGPARVCPRLDPVEGLWANLKGVELANLCRDTIGEVLDAARQGIARVRRESRLLFSFLRHCELEL